MSKVKTISRLTAAVLLLLFLLASCGNKKANEAAAAAAGRELYNIDIYTHTSGTFAYVLGVALADIINEQHPWIRATAVESPGPAPNELMMYEADDFKRKHTIYMGNGDNAWRGSGVFKDKQNTRSKLAFNYGIGVTGVLTNDPKIKTLADFKGKTLALRPGGSATAPWIRTMIEMSGITDVKYEGLDMGPSVEACLSGAVSGWLGLLNYTSEDLTKLIGNPATIEFLSRASYVGFIDLPYEIDQVLQHTPGGPYENFYTSVGTVKALAVSEQQTNPWIATMGVSHFLVDQDFPDEVMYEIAKLIGTNNARLTEYHPMCAFITPKTMSYYTFPSEFHTGTMKYFEEVGVKPMHVSDLKN
jgi:TRAP transporter TAXI family solute receptor